MAPPSDRGSPSTLPLGGPVTAPVSTTCPLDCPDTCALAVSVDEGRVTGVAAGGAAPLTGGFICGKVSRFADRLYHPQRIRRPLRRVGPKGEGAFEPVTWDDALELVTERFREIRARRGGEAILGFHYGGSNGVLTDGFLDRLYFARLGASRLERTICAVPSTLAATGMYGKMPGVAFEDYPEAECIVIWGQNPKASSVHLVPLLRRAKRRGAFVAVVDPRRTFSAREVDLHLPVLPGTDLPLALALIRHWRRTGALDDAFLDAHAVRADLLLARAEAWSVEAAAKVCGVPPDDIVALARRYAAASPAVIRCGWGVERNRHGGQAIAAILAMPALLGKFGVRGGGYTMSNSGATRVDLDAVLGGVPWETRSLNMTRLGKLLTEPLDPPVEGLFVYNSNPAATVPGQRDVLRGLARADLFTVVFDQVMTDTAAYADVVLPATTFLEHADVRVSYGHYVLGGVRPVVEPCGEARPNPEVFAELGRRMGFDDPAFHWSPDEYLARVAGALRPGDGRIDVETLRRGGACAVEFAGDRPVQFGTVFPRTPDEKVDLAPSVLGNDPYAYDAGGEAYPLALISPSSSRLVSSTFGETSLGRLHLTIHPHDAEARGVTDGRAVRVFNDLGEVHCHARVRGTVRPGVVSMPKGAWRRASLNGLTSTALCPDHVSTVGGAACFNDARVEVEAL